MTRPVTGLQASSSEVIDDYTVKVNLNTYINSIMSTIGGTFVVSKAAYDAHGGGKDAETWMRSNPVGTGPFKLDSFKPTVSLRGVRNENYWQPGKPYLDAIRNVHDTRSDDPGSDPLRPRKMM